MKHFKNRRSSRALALAVVSVACGGVWANQGAGGIDVGGVLLIPRLEVKAAHDSNIFETSQKARSSAFVETIPSIELKAQQGLDVYSLTLEAEDNRYRSVSEANHTNGGVVLSVHKDFNRRNRIDLDASLKRQHDLGATGVLTNNSTSMAEPAAYDQKVANLRYGFGGKDAKAQIEFFGSIDERNYKDRAFDLQNSRATTMGSTLYYRVAPKTRALAEFRRKDLAYDKDRQINGTLQKSELTVDSYLVGLAWDATEKTNGYAKIGQRSRESSVAGVRDANSTGWEVGVSYQPTARSLIQLSTSRDFGLDTNSPSQSLFTDGVNTSLSWGQQWTDKIDSSIRWTVYDEQVQDTQGRNLKRRDINEVAVQMGWNISHRVKATLGYIYKKRDEKLRPAGIASGQTDDSFNKNVYSIGISMAI